jgi:hypothetical protein
MSQNQLSEYNNFNTENMVFSKPEVGNIPGQKINFKRVRIATKNSDGSIGDLIFSTPDKLHSFGLQESRDMATDKLNGYVLPLCLWNRNGPTENEKSFTDMFTQVTEHTKKYLVEHKEEIEKYDLDYSDLKKFNPLFWKMDKGKPVEGRGPMLYCKVLLNKKNNKIHTIFVDEETNKEIDPFTILNKPCHVTAAIKFESVFIGNKVSLQVKLYEVVVRQIDNSVRGLLRPSALKMENAKPSDRLVAQSASTAVGKPVAVNMYNSLGHEDDDEEEDEEEDEEVEEVDDEDEEDEDGSIVEEEPAAPPQTAPPPTPEEEETTEPAEKKKRAPAKPRAAKK